VIHGLLIRLLLQGTPQLACTLARADGSDGTIRTHTRADRDDCSRSPARGWMSARLRLRHCPPEVAC
jgi:hypothetical protein